MKQRQTLLDEIERDVLDQATPLATALRKCVALGGHAHSREIRDWATRELSGYKPADDGIPPYRTVPAMLQIDCANLAYRATGQTISPGVLPDFARDDVKEQMTFHQGVGIDLALDLPGGHLLDQVQAGPAIAIGTAALADREWQRATAARLQADPHWEEQLTP